MLVEYAAVPVLNHPIGHTDALEPAHPQVEYLILGTSPDE
jgi:hypothetical protein